MRAIRFGLLVLVVGCVAGAAQAADLLWVEPESQRASAGETVRLRVVEGPPFAGSPSVGHRGRLPLFQRVWNAGRADLVLETGDPSASGFRAESGGLQLVVLSTRPRDTGQKGRITHFGKTFFVVGEGAGPTQLHFSEVGQRLEIVPQANPVETARGGGALAVQVLLDREPLPGARVRAVRRDDKGAGRPDTAPVTDEIGLARLRLDGGGDWLVFVEQRVPCGDCGGAGHETLVSTLFVRGGT